MLMKAKDRLRNLLRNIVNPIAKLPVFLQNLSDVPSEEKTPHLLQISLELRSRNNLRKCINQFPLSKTFCKIVYDFCFP